MTRETLFTLQDVAHATGGRIASGSDYASVTGVSTDSRSVAAGDLFVALKGEHFDAHDFLGQVRDAGAGAVLVSRPSDVPLPQVEVGDTRLALGRLAAFRRERFDGTLIALTGSNGKTTVKEMLAAILREHAGNAEAVLATEGNLNNDIGMPLTLLKLREQHRYAVIEMGMNHLGEIDYLTRLARPDVALINNAHRAHVGELGGIEVIARAKGEIFAGIKSGGMAIVNADDSFASYWRVMARDKAVLTFGLGKADVQGSVQPDGSIGVTTPHGQFNFKLQVPGLHNVRNALAAIAAAFSINVSAEAIVAGLSGYAGTKGRLQRKAGQSGAVVIDDSYNANPDSMAAAVAVLAEQPGRRVFVMGDMGELGGAAPQLHGEVGRMAKAAGIDIFLALGSESRHAAQAFGEGAQHFDDVEQLISVLRSSLAPDVTVLVKGSRFMKMERVVEAIAASH